MITNSASVERLSLSSAPVLWGLALNFIKRNLETKVREKIAPLHPLLNRSLLECTWGANDFQVWEIIPKHFYIFCLCTRVPCTAKRSNQSPPKGINPEYSLERLKLKLQYLGHFTWRTDLLKKILMLWKIEGKRRRGWQRMRGLDVIIDLRDMSLSKLQEIVMNRKAWCAIVRGVTKT